MDESTPLASN